MKVIRVIILGLFLPFASAQADENVLYILSAKAKLLSAPSFGADTVDNLTKGEKVISVHANNRWFKVTYKGKEGWLSRLSVSPHPPMKRSRRLVRADESLQNESRKRASVVATTAAVRGLRGDSRDRLNGGNVMDFEALNRVENTKIDDNELDKFLANID